MLYYSKSLICQNCINLLAYSVMIHIQFVTKSKIHRVLKHSYHHKLQTSTIYFLQHYLITSTTLLQHGQSTSYVAKTEDQTHGHHVSFSYISHSAPTLISCIRHAVQES